MDTPHHHVAVCAFPFGTHAAPLLHLINHLASASFLNTVKSNSALFSTKNNATNVIPCNLEEENNEAGGNINPIENFIVSAPSSIRRRMEEVEEEVGVKISCVISDAFLWFCCEIAEDRGLSWFPIWTANVVSLSAAFYTDVLRTKFGILKQGIEGREDVLVDCVPGFSNVRLRDIVDCVPGLVTESIDSIFDQMVYKMGLMLPKAKAVVVNTFENLSPTITNDLKSKKGCSVLDRFL